MRLKWKKRAAARADSGRFERFAVATFGDGRECARRARAG